MKQINTVQVQLCGVDVPIYVELDKTNSTVAGSLPPLSGRLLYRWEIYEGEKISCVYIGKAKNGIDRPTRTYPAVVADLRQNRNISTLCLAPIKPYFPRDPWGFRWIHHQLEAASHRISHGNEKSERIQLVLFAFGISSDQNLNKREQEEIKNAKSIYESLILANGKPSMARQNRAKLDSVWICVQHKA